MREFLTACLVVIGVICAVSFATVASVTADHQNSNLDRAARYLNLR